MEVLGLFQGQIYNNLTTSYNEQLSILYIKVLKVQQTVTQFWILDYLDSRPIQAQLPAAL